jgi:predicted deacylase
MTRALWAVLFWLVSASNLWAIDFNKYHSQEEINSYLKQVAADHPDIARFHFLGYSQRGRDINYVVIAKGDAEAMPAIYLNGTHHGNEKSSTETILAVIDYLVTNRTQPQVAELLENYAIYLQPLVNPDGHAANTREDVQGRDPNRDYSYPERSDEDSFKTPQIKLVKELADRVRFRAAAAYHSGMEAVLWPWCFTSQRPADNDTFYTISKATARAMGMTRYVQSHSDYATRGEFIDYVYMAHGTVAVTVEVSNDATPPPSRLNAVVQRAVAGSMAFMLQILELDRGQLKIEHPTEAVLVAQRKAAAAGGAARVE